MVVIHRRARVVKRRDADGVPIASEVAGFMEELVADVAPLEMHAGFERDGAACGVRPRQGVMRDLSGLRRPANLHSVNAWVMPHDAGDGAGTLDLPTGGCGCWDGEKQDRQRD